MLRGADQLQYLQHLLYLLPPCNCDTLLRLLSLLHTVQSFAQDSIGTNDEEVRHRCPSQSWLSQSNETPISRYSFFSIQITGNKMTAANLAVIFGPNLLQSERGDGSPHIYAMGIEDSTAIISVTLLLVQNYRRLFTVWSRISSFQTVYRLKQGKVLVSEYRRVGSPNYWYPARPLSSPTASCPLTLFESSWFPPSTSSSVFIQ